MLPSGGGGPTAHGRSAGRYYFKAGAPLLEPDWQSDPPGGVAAEGHTVAAGRQGVGPPLPYPSLFPSRSPPLPTPRVVQE